MENNPAPKSRRRWPMVLGLAAAGFLLLLIAGYFVVTSSGFLTSFVVPRVGKAIGAQLTVREIALQPMSSIRLTGVTLRTTGEEPLFQANEAVVQYNLRQILGGHYEVPLVQLKEPTVNVVQAADGTSNLDPLLKSQAQPSTAKAAPIRVTLGRLGIERGTVKWTLGLASNETATLHVQDLTTTLEHLANARPAALTVAAKTALAYGPRATPTNTLSGNLSLKADLDLDDALLPKAAKLSATDFSIDQATGLFVQLAKSSLGADVDWTPTEIRTATLRFRQAGRDLGSIQLSGPFQAQTLDGNLSLRVPSLSEQVLNFAGAPFGLSFNLTQLSSTNSLRLANGARSIALEGNFLAAALRCKKGPDTTPVIDLKADFRLELDRARQEATIERLDLKALRQQAPLLAAELAKPMRLNWGATNTAPAESSARIVATRLDLAEWKPFLGGQVRGGRVDLDLNLNSAQSGHRIRLDGTANATDLSVDVGTNRLDRLNASVALQTQVQDYVRVAVEKLKATTSLGSQPLLDVELSGNADLQTTNLALQLTGKLELPAAASMAPMPDTKFTSGTLSFNGSATSTRGTNYGFQGQVGLKGVRGAVGDYRFQDLSMNLTQAAQISGSKLTLQQVQGTLAEGSGAPGRFELGGEIDLATQSGRLVLKLGQFAESILRPFLSPSLNGQELIAANLDGTLIAKFDPKAESTVQGDLQLEKLTVRSTPKAAPVGPLAFKTQFDVASRTQAVDFRRCTVWLSPTARATNQASLEGRIDFQRTNAVAGKLKLTSPGLDLTPYYDIYMGGQTTTAKATAPATAPTETEPEPMKLPVGDFQIDAAIAKLFLRELAISNCQASVRVTSNSVAMGPADFTLAGAPVHFETKVDLSVPGYAYDLTCRTARLPLQPLVDSFAPDYRGMYVGFLDVDTQVKGQGQTGVSLQKNLSGKIMAVCTNANIQMVGPRTKLLMTPIVTILRVPEVMQSPVEQVVTEIQLGGGKIDLKRFSTAGQAFTADVAGTIPIAPILTNSPLDLPVKLALRRSVAERANLVPADAPTNATFVTLPQFARIKGTIGVPRTETDKAILAGMALKSVAGVPGLVGDKAGGILQGIGSLLSGPTTRTQTNAPATTGAATNAAATNTPAKPTGLSPLDLLLSPLRPTNAATAKPSNVAPASAPATATKPTNSAATPAKK